MVINPVIHEHIQIPEGFSFDYQDDVFSIMDFAFRKRLNEFMNKYLAVRAVDTEGILTPIQIQKFPFLEDKQFRNEVFSRRQDLAELSKLIKKIPKGSTILEVGGWNGWLSKWLQTRDLEVVSTDIFRDHQFGLAAKQFHTTNKSWISVQTDISSPAIYKKNFDLIVVNHCLQFLPLATDVLNKYYNLLKPGGLMIVLGIDYRKNEKLQEQKVKQFRDKFYAKNGFEVNFYPSNGYIDSALLQHFREKAFKFISYKLSVKARILKKLKGDHCGIYYVQKD